MLESLVDLAIEGHRGLGRVYATPELIRAIPRPAIARAIRCHGLAMGDSPETRHSFEGTLFRIRTDGDTTMWLEQGAGEGHPIHEHRRPALASIDEQP
jgi:hypothetical protein